MLGIFDKRRTPNVIEEGYMRFEEVLEGSDGRRGVIDVGNDPARVAYPHEYPSLLGKSLLVFVQHSNLLGCNVYETPWVSAGFLEPLHGMSNFSLVILLNTYLVEGVGPCSFMQSRVLEGIGATVMDTPKRHVLDASDRGQKGIYKLLEILARDPIQCNLYQSMIYCRQ